MLEVRKLRYKILRSGFRTRDVTLVTTLLDAEVYTATELARLYGARWGVETDLKHLKQTMKMVVLKCKHVDGILKELTVYAMAYQQHGPYGDGGGGTAPGSGRGPDQFC